MFSFMLGWVAGRPGGGAGPATTPGAHAGSSSYSQGQAQAQSTWRGPGHPELSEVTAKDEGGEGRGWD